MLDKKHRCGGAFFTQSFNFNLFNFTVSAVNALALYNSERTNFNIVRLFRFKFLYGFACFFITLICKYFFAFVGKKQLKQLAEPSLTTFNQRTFQRRL